MNGQRYVRGMLSPTDYVRIDTHENVWERVTREQWNAIPDARGRTMTPQQLVAAIQAEAYEAERHAAWESNQIAAQAERRAAWAAHWAEERAKQEAEERRRYELRQERAAAREVNERFARAITGLVIKQLVGLPLALDPITYRPSSPLGPHHIQPWARGGMVDGRSRREWSSMRDELDWMGGAYSTRDIREAILEARDQ